MSTKSASIWALGLVCLAAAPAAWAGPGPEFSDVFGAGQNAFQSVRIPSVVVTKVGTVLAFAEVNAMPPSFHPHAA